MTSYVISYLYRSEEASIVNSQEIDIITPAGVEKPLWGSDRARTCFDRITYLVSFRRIFFEFSDHILFYFMFCRRFLLFGMRRD